MKLQQERVQLTAVAVQQGWAAQLDRDIAAARRAVSTLKERALFTTARELRELEDKARRLDGLIAQHSEDRAAAALVWTDTRRAALVREAEWERGARGLVLAHKTADERRRWAVGLFTESGKVDLARRRGAAAVAINKHLTAVGRPPPAGSALAVLAAHAPSRTLTAASGSLMELAAPPVPSTAKGA